MYFEKRISSTQGTYLATEDKDSFEKMLDKRPLILHSMSIPVNSKTNLHGWFDREIIFKGFLNNNEAVFYLGQCADLFEGEIFYYDITFILSVKCIGKTYVAGTFANVFLKQNEEGKYYWK